MIQARSIVCASIADSQPLLCFLSSPNLVYDVRPSLFVKYDTVTVSPNQNIIIISFALYLHHPCSSPAYSTDTLSD